MQNTTFSSALIHQPKLKSAASKSWISYHNSIALAFAGGLLLILLGFILLIIFTMFEKNDAALNYAGVGSLIAAFILFGVSAHFMDKSDENKRQYEKSRIERFTQKQF